MGSPRRPSGASRPWRTRRATTGAGTGTHACHWRSWWCTGQMWLCSQRTS
uniref:Iso2 n=1 Tax=Arundo donax TaxID=35708 RepID=A0A0A9H673_ARUDO